jgi:hypothetical protein
MLWGGIRQIVARVSSRKYFFFKIPDANVIKDLVILRLIKMLHSKQINRKEVSSNHKTKGKIKELTR